LTVPKSIDWLYARKSCNTCKKAAAHCAGAGATAKQSVDATKVKMDAAAATGLLGTVTKVVAARGQSVVEFDLKKDKPDTETLLGYLMGPTGNLRAPTARVGKTLLVGYHPDAYTAVLGG
jgi:arsenate reductase-like glutaredoxin family protein